MLWTEEGVCPYRIAPTPCHSLENRLFTVRPEPVEGSASGGWFDEFTTNGNITSLWEIIFSGFVVSLANAQDRFLLSQESRPVDSRLRGNDTQSPTTKETCCGHWYR